MIKKILFCLACGFFWAQGLGASAATINVVPGGSIQSAVTSAAAGDTINVAAGTYTEHVTIDKNLTIIGAGAGATIVDGSKIGTVFKIGDTSAAKTVVLQGMTIQNGSGTSATDSSTGGTGTVGGGIMDIKANLTLANCVIQNNSVTYGGGGIYVSNGGTVALNGTTVTANSASKLPTSATRTLGGGILLDYGYLTMGAGSYITNNSVDGSYYSGGGAVYCSGDNGSGSVTLSGGEVSGNTAHCSNTTAGYETMGGGIYVDRGTFTMNDGLITNNKSGFGGGGVFVDAVYGPASFTMNGGTISNNTTGTSGGGIYFDQSVVSTINGGTITGNSSANAGGLYLDLSDSFAMTGGTVSNNHATNGIGGGFTNNGSMNLTGGTITGNVSTDGGSGYAGYGGGIYNNNSTASIVLNGATISNNSATNYGGGIFNDGATLTVSGGAISGNTSGSGGGIYNTSGKLTVQGTGSITGNIAKASYGGGIYSDIKSVTFSGTGVAVKQNQAASPSTQANWYQGWGVYMTGTPTTSGGFVASTQVTGNTLLGSSCTPNCSAKTCGSDGCGGTCGTCNSGYTCNASGTCAVNCTNQCTSGAKQCSGNGVQTCSDTNGDGCTEWGTAVACQTGYTCSSGTCAASGNGPALSFVSPTDASGSTVTRTYTQPSVTVGTSSLNTFTFNWNGAAYPIYDSSLVLALNFNNNSSIGESSTKFIDISKNANNGTCSGAACPTYTSSGKFGGAYTFNGSSKYITCGSAASLNPTNALTIEAWIKPSSLSGERAIVHKQNWNNKTGYYLETIGKQVEFALGNGSNIALDGATSLVTGAWYHVAGVLNGTTMTIYVNGKADGTGSFSGTVKTGTESLLIGKNAYWSGEFFNGPIDEVRVYNRALSANEIAMQYQSEFKKVTASSWQFSDTVSGLASGTYSYSASATDTANNTGSTETRTLTVNTGTASSGSAQTAAFASAANPTMSIATASSQTQNSSIQAQIEYIQQRIRELTASIQASIALSLIH